jgi:hypothetical protein
MPWWAITLIVAGAVIAIALVTLFISIAMHTEMLVRLPPPPKRLDAAMRRLEAFDESRHGKAPASNHEDNESEL